MKRPDFLTSPGAWNVARTDQSRVDYACPIERSERPKASWHPAERFFAPLLIIVIVLLAWGYL